MVLWVKTQLSLGHCFDLSSADCQQQVAVTASLGVHITAKI